MQRVSPLENPKSLIRILQDLLAHAVRDSADFRWAFGLLYVISKVPDNARLIGQTAIPSIAMENLRLSKEPPSKWSTNSLEAYSIMMLLYMAQFSSDSLDSKGILELVEPVMEDGGLHGIVSSMLCAYLGLDFSRFPNYGINAAALIAEVMESKFHIWEFSCSLMSPTLDDFAD